MAHAELSVTYTWSRALLQLTIQLTNLTNPYLIYPTNPNNPYHSVYTQTLMAVGRPPTLTIIISLPFGMWDTSLTVINRDRTKGLEQGGVTKFEAGRPLVWIHELVNPGLPVIYNFIV